MSYVVLARKWRPQTFADLTGQQHVAQTLGNAIQLGRVPHAILFTGARGVGKTSSARILAMALNCHKGPSVSPCGVCPACTEIQQGANIDVLEIDGASNRGIGEIRELRDSVRYAPNRDRYKVYIIDEVHMLTTEAFNALLKTLEEPPPQVVFILATTESHKIPVTILSRCQRFDFRRIPHADIVRRLQFILEQEQIQADIDVLGLVARQAAGGMRDALSLLDQIIAFAGTTITMDQASSILGAAERRRLFDLSDAIIRRDTNRALTVVDEAMSFGVSLTHFGSELVEHLRDLTVLAAGASGELTSLTETELQLAAQQLSRTDRPTLHRMFEIAVEAAEQIARSNYPRLVMDMALVRLSSLEPMSTVDDILAALHRLAAGESLPPAPASAPPSASAPTRAPVATPLSPAAPPQQALPDPVPAPAPAVAPAPVEVPAPAPAAIPAPSPAADPVAPAEPAITADAGPVTSVEPADLFTRLSQSWASAVRWLESVDRPHIASLVRMAYVLRPLDEGAVRLALHEDRAHTVTGVELGLVREALRELGFAVEVSVLTTDEVEPSELSEAFQLSQAERERREERRRELETFVQTHDATAIILKSLPGSSIRRLLILEEELTENIDEQA